MDAGSKTILSDLVAVGIESDKRSERYTGHQDSHIEVDSGANW